MQMILDRYWNRLFDTLIVKLIDSRNENLSVVKLKLQDMEILARVASRIEMRERKFQSAERFIATPRMTLLHSFYLSPLKGAMS